MSGGESLPRRVEQAIASMDAHTREVFLLHGVHDLGFNEIASRLGMPEGDVEAEIARALVILLRAVDGGGRGT